MMSHFRMKSFLGHNAQSCGKLGSKTLILILINLQVYLIRANFSILGGTSPTIEIVDLEDPNFTCTIPSYTSKHDIIPMVFYNKNGYPIACGQNDVCVEFTGLE